MMSAEHLMEGSPPSQESTVHVENWQQPPFNRWAFSHMREIFPTQAIPCGSVTRRLGVHDRASEIDDVVVHRVGAGADAGTGADAGADIDGGADTVGSVLSDTFTDAVIILHRGDVVLERYPGRMDVDTPHLLMSVTKSVIGCVAGILIDQNRLNPDREAADYVPEIGQSGYRGARVRDILDMRTGVKFSEDYTDPDSEVRQMERHTGWRDGLDDPIQGIYAYLTSLRAQGVHGGAFEYRSADADMLGWICERAAGARMSELISELIWAPMGAEYDANITCDSVGTAIHDGGMSACARDLARFGQLLLDDGNRDGHQIVPARWLYQTRAADAGIRSAFATSEHEPVLSGGWYRNQFWLVPGPSGIVTLGLGIHGQMLLVDHQTATVAVKFSTWPDPQDPGYLVDTIRAFCSAGRQLAGLAGVARSSVAGQPAAT
jgi:CubicO group peptidase (beta-lactamase class C family)